MESPLNNNVPEGRSVQGWPQISNNNYLLMNKPEFNLCYFQKGWPGKNPFRHPWRTKE